MGRNARFFNDVWHGKTQRFFLLIILNKMTSVKNRRTGNISTLIRGTQKSLLKKIRLTPETKQPKRQASDSTYRSLMGGKNGEIIFGTLTGCGENDSFVGTIYRVEGGLKGAESHFHGSRRTGAVNIQIYTRKAGAWALLGTGQFPNENNVWYTHRLVMKGGQHQIYLRKREKGITARGLASHRKANCRS